MDNILPSVIGGILIGLSASMMLLFNGRVTGISNIISSLLSHSFKENYWRYLFIVGLLIGGLALKLYNSETFVNTSQRGILALIISGFLVGFGTQTGSGCTSGHGVCGVSRFSKRSIVATVVFIIFGIISVRVMTVLSGAL